MSQIRCRFITMPPHVTTGDCSHYCSNQDLRNVVVGFFLTFRISLSGTAGIPTVLAKSIDFKSFTSIGCTHTFSYKTALHIYRRFRKHTNNRRDGRNCTFLQQNSFHFEEEMIFILSLNSQVLGHAHTQRYFSKKYRTRQTHPG